MTNYVDIKKYSTNVMSEVLFNLIVDVIVKEVKLTAKYRNRLLKSKYKPFCKCYFVNNTDNMPIGVILFEVKKDKLYIKEVAVDSQFRRQHIALQLLEAILADYPHTTMKLHVRSSNDPAICLYKKLGFISFPSLSFYLNPMEIAKFMVRFTT